MGDLDIPRGVWARVGWLPPRCARGCGGCLTKGTWIDGRRGRGPGMPAMGQGGWDLSVNKCWVDDQGGLGVPWLGLGWAKKRGCDC